MRMEEEHAGRMVSGDVNVVLNWLIGRCEVGVDHRWELARGIADNVHIVPVCRIRRIGFTRLDNKSVSVDVNRIGS